MTKKKNNNNLHSTWVLQYLSQSFYVHKCVHNISKELYARLVFLTDNNGKDLEQLFASSGLGKLKPKHISKVTAMKKNHMQKPSTGCFTMIIFSQEFYFYRLYHLSLEWKKKKKKSKKTWLVMLQVKRWAYPKNYKYFHERIKSLKSY